ncbi:response regulator [Sulfitobacter sp. F26204]|uniref:response regulator n=1 Tax=Sulfitobacter sp. F26204 TaxID=2996014 RepID=UPI00225E1E12|nr:response regulator [Sulfitobacter sp. F26204]MCX7558348.1 response regulator [Sulfitobacter sp. F26204]
MNEMDAHLLIVDDDERIRTLLQKFLMRHGFLVTAARDAGHARRILAGLDFDLIVLDVMMPGEDGLALTASLRETMETPILLLTAKGETGNRIEGLEAGADDYLAKPFEPKELLLRINAILRRMPDTRAEDTAPKVLSLGAIRYDLERGEMWQGDVLVRLTATEILLMKIFSAQPGQPLSRAKLVEELGRDRGQAQERAVDVQITRLRRKIEDNPKQPRYLQTVRGAGYMLAPD